MFLKHKRKHDFITPPEDDESKIDNKTHRKSKKNKKTEIATKGSSQNMKINVKISNSK